MDATPELPRHESAEIESDVSKDLEREDQEDRLSNLPDDILSLILERLRLLDAARTSVLSRRWVHLFSQRSRIVIDIGAFYPKDHGYEFTLDDSAKCNAILVQATKSMLSPTSQRPIRLLRVRFNVAEASIEVVRCVDRAMADRRVASLHFVMLPEILDEDCAQDYRISYGRLFMRFLAAGPRAFGGLSYLHIQCLELSVDGMTNVLNACNNLEHLCLHKCAYLSVLEIEHPRLTTLTFYYCVFEMAELRWLPRLTRLTCEVWAAPMNQQYPISFGHVPQLSTLILRNSASIGHKTIQLSEFLSNVMITEMELDFTSLRIWVQPEVQKLAGPVLQNLQFLCLRNIHEECDLEWTIFFLEAAPLLKEMQVQVWDHTSCRHQEDASPQSIELWEQLYPKASDLSWQPPDDLKHYCLKEFIIMGYQVEDKFTRYIRRVVEAAVKLERLILLDSGRCQKCNFSPSTRFPRTDEARDVTRKQILEWASSAIKIGIGS